MAAPCCDDFAAVYTVSNGGGSEGTGWEEVGGFGGEAVGVKIRVWGGWEEREKQRLGVCGRRQVRRVGQGAKDGARGAVRRGIDETGGGLFGGGGGKVDCGGQGSKPVVRVPKLGGAWPAARSAVRRRWRPTNEERGRFLGGGERRRRGSAWMARVATSSSRSAVAARRNESRTTSMQGMAARGKAEIA